MDRDTQLSRDSTWGIELRGAVLFAFCNLLSGHHCPVEVCKLSRDTPHNHLEYSANQCRVLSRYTVLPPRFICRMALTLITFSVFGLIFD